MRRIIGHSPHRVVNLDCLTYAGNLDSLREVEDSERYRFERVDIRDRNAVHRVFDEHEPNAALHLAAESHVDRSIDGPDDFVQTNVVGTFNLLTEFGATAPARRREAGFSSSGPPRRLRSNQRKTRLIQAFSGATTSISANSSAVVETP